MPHQYLTIKPPLGGVVESTGFEAQPPDTCDYAFNCWAHDNQRRDRLSTRPGITSYATGGITAPGVEAVRMLAEVNYATAVETSRYLVASAAGKVYKLASETAGWTLITSTANLSSANPVQAAPFGNKLFIADWEAITSDNSGTAGVIGTLRSTKTAGSTTPILWGFGASGDGWTETTTTGEYGYDLGTHTVLGSLLSGKSGVRFAGPGALSRTGIALPADGKSATWHAKVGPWDGDARILGGIGSGGTGVPGEYALGYDADLDRVYAYIGGALVTLDSGLNYAPVSGKKYCLFKIKLTNSSGTITADMTINDLADDSELLSHTATRAYTSSTLSSQVVSDESFKAVFAEEVGYAAGTTAASGTISLTDTSVTTWNTGDTPACAVDDVFVFTGSAVKGVFTAKGFSSDGTAVHMSPAVIGDSVAISSGLRYHILKPSGTRDTFVLPDNKGWAATLSGGNLLRVSSHEDEYEVAVPAPSITISLSVPGGGGTDEVQKLEFANITSGTFKLSLSGYGTTSSISYTSTRPNMKSRLEVALDGLSGLNVDVGEWEGGIDAYRITVVEPAATDIALISATDTDLLNTESKNLNGLWEITSASSDLLTIKPLEEGLVTPDEYGYPRTSVEWSLPRSAKVLDLEKNTLTRWAPTATKGDVPHGCKMITTWQDRVILGNDQVNPHVWYMSRGGSPYDFLYGSEDLGSPVAGTTFQGGLIGEPLTALIPHNKSCLLFGCKDSMWVMRGDPMQGGYIERLSDDIGVIGPWAHTKTDTDSTFFLSHLGLYMMPSGCGDMPKAVGEDRLPLEGPKFWRDTDQLGYDAVNSGLVLSTSAAATATWKNIWIDLKKGGFWPFGLEYAGLREITAMLHWQPAAGRDDTFDQQLKGSLMMGTHNGKVARFNQASDTDEGGAAITATARIGPINITPNASQAAMVQEVKGIGTYSSGGSSTQTLYVGHTAQEARSAAIAGTLGFPMAWSSANNQLVDNPRMSGHSIVLNVSATGGHGSWGFEAATITVTPLGKSR